MARKLTEVASKLAAKPAPKRPVVYIVDFENIPKTDVAALLRKEQVIMVVLAANSTNTVTPSTLETIEANPERVDVIIGRITRKEFVDKLVTAKIGEYAFRFPEAEIIVLANDKDYADLANHLNDHWERAVPIKHIAPAKSRAKRAPRAAKDGSARKPKAATRHQPKTAAKLQPERAPNAKTAAKPKAKAAAKPKARPANTTPITNPDAEAVRALLANLPERRLPKSEAALLNAVRNYRESVGLRSRPSTIVKHLSECGVIDTSKSPVHYVL